MHVGGLCIAVCLLSLCVGRWLSCMGVVRMCLAMVCHCMSVNVCAQVGFEDVLFVFMGFKAEILLFACAYMIV